MLVFVMSMLHASSVCFSQELPEIVLNEINCDNPGGPDNAEFIELFGVAGQTLDSLVLVFFEGTDDLSYASYDLDGFQLDQNGFFVAGSSGVPGVDLVLPGGIISNGQDAIAIYWGDATDFPNGSIAVTDLLIDAAVYGTNDPSDTGLIAAFGLDAIGYIQLNETIQTALPDFSISRIPDGGEPFAFAVYVIQSITPGTFNDPPCQGGLMQFTDQTNSTLVCQSDQILPIEFEHLNTNLTSLHIYVITDYNDFILDTTSATAFDFSGFDTGQYHIYGLSFNGTLTGYDASADVSVLNLNADVCASLSDNFLQVEITACINCDGGQILSSEGPAFAICQNTTGELVFQNSASIANEAYTYFLTSADDLIIGEIEDTIDLFVIPTGTYHIHGLAYSGQPDVQSIQTGQPVSGITTTACADLSDNFIALTVNTCQYIEPCSRLFFSEYLEGNAGTRALELYNPSINAVQLDNYSILLYTNGNQNPLDTLQLSGILEPLSTLLITNPGTGAGNGLADPEVVALGNIVDFIANFTGNDAIELRHENIVIDVIGVVGENPGNQTGWFVSGGGTSNNDIRRKPTVQAPTENWQVSSYQWEVFAPSNYEGLGNHFAETCSDALIAGFLNDFLSVDENEGIITLEIQCQNAIDLTEIQLTIAGGSATEMDYTVSVPASLYFDENTSLLTINIEIIDDLIPEPVENLILMLSHENSIYWTNQVLEIQIRQSDDNCSAGSLSVQGMTLPIQQCSDLSNTAIEIVVDEIFPESSYLFVITDSNDYIIDTTSVNPIDLDFLESGTFHIHGISYTGQLISESILSGQYIADILADSCISISSNFIEVLRQPCLVTGCDGGNVSTQDGSSFIAICEGIGNTTIIPVHNSESVDDNYIYVLTNNDGIILDILDSTWSSEGTENGNYMIHGISYTGETDSLTLQTGLNIDGITATGCIGFSENNIEILVATCPEINPCTRLIFSEYIEETGSNKAIELYNPSPVPVNLADYSIRMYSNGSLTPTSVLHSTSIINPYDVFVVQSPGNGLSTPDPQLTAQSDTTHAIADLSGNDAFELLYQDSVIDVIGIVGDNPGQLGWQFGNASTSNHVLVRRPEVTSPVNDWSIVSGQWIAYEAQDFSHIGAHDAYDCALSEFPALSFLQSGENVNEGNNSVNFILYASNPGQAFEATLVVSGSATNGEDYEFNFPLNMIIPSGINYITLEVMTIADQIAEGSETIVVEIQNTANIILGNNIYTINVGEVTGAYDRNSLSFSLWPNPANQYLHVFSEQPVHEILLRDQSGRVVLIHNNKFTGHQTLDIRGIDSGIYFLQMISDSMQANKKIIITHHSVTD